MIEVLGNLRIHGHHLIVLLSEDLIALRNNIVGPNCKWLSHHTADEINDPLSRQTVPILSIWQIGLNLWVVLDFGEEVMHSQTFICGYEQILDFAAIDIYSTKG